MADYEPIFSRRKTLDSTPFGETNEYLKRVKNNRDKYAELYFSK